MSHQIAFTIPGEPVAKGRARAFVRAGRVAHYTPAKTEILSGRRHAGPIVGGLPPTGGYAGPASSADRSRAASMAASATAAGGRTTAKRDFCASRTKSRCCCSRAGRCRGCSIPLMGCVLTASWLCCAAGCEPLCTGAAGGSVLRLWIYHAQLRGNPVSFVKLVTLRPARA